MRVDEEERFAYDLLDWSEQNLRSFWWRNPDLPLYQLFITEFFLARTRANVVEKFSPEFFERFPDFGAIEEAPESEIAEIIRPMGLQNRRAEALNQIANSLDDGVPEDVDSLLELPRVGPYVANATLCFGLDRHLPIVDRNVDRAYRRVFGERWKSMGDGEQWEFARAMLPKGEARRYNLALLDFASLVCTASSPDCEECFASGYCTYYSETEQSEEDESE